MDANQPKENLLEQLRLAQAKNERMQQLGTTQGFYIAFFRALDDYKTNVECFEALNQEYYELFKEYRYANYDSFRYARDNYNRYKPQRK